MVVVNVFVVNIGTSWSDHAKCRRFNRLHKSRPPPSPHDTFFQTINTFLLLPTCSDWRETWPDPMGFGRLGKPISWPRKTSYSSDSQPDSSSTNSIPRTCCGPTTGLHHRTTQDYHRTNHRTRRHRDLGLSAADQRRASGIERSVNHRGFKGAPAGPRAKVRQTRSDDVRYSPQIGNRQSAINNLFDPAWLHGHLPRSHSCRFV